MGSRERLTRVLGRERLKDTSLDYGLTPGGTAKAHGISPASDESGDAMRAYAERRGLVPMSEIVLRERPVVPAQAVSARPRRGLFAGLKLDAVRPTPVAAPVVSSVPMDRDIATDQLARSVGAYARAWADADRMRQAGLPVLPHQTEALARASQAVDAQRPRFGGDLDAALSRTPGLAQGAGTDAGLSVLIEAGQVESERRLALEARAREAVLNWSQLEQAYEKAETAYDYQAQREISGRMEQFAKALKRDPHLDGVLRQRGPEFGVAAGSRLGRVVRSQEIDRVLTRELGLRPSQGYGLSR